VPPDKCWGSKHKIVHTCLFCTENKG